MLNHITIMGRLTRDPELRRTGNGVAVTSFTVAVDRDIKSSDGETDTDFIDCVAWRQTGEFALYLLNSMHASESKSFFFGKRSRSIRSASK